MSGFLPSKTSVQFRAPNGDIGTVPAATETAAGVMTAEHVRMLMTLWTIHQTKSSDVIVLEPQAAPVNAVTREQLGEVIKALPRPQDVMALQRQVATLQDRLHALPAPTGTDEGLRAIVEHVIGQAAAMDHRLQSVERVIEILRSVAEVKAALEQPVGEAA